MKNAKFILKLAFACMMCFSCTCSWAQFGPAPALPLVAETDFSVSGGDADYYHSLDMVDGLGNSALRPTITGGSFALVDSTAYDVTSSEFMDNACYGVTPNPVRLDSLRMFDNEDSGEWGLVVSGGKRGVSNALAMSFTVGGLKNGGRYRVEVDYCNPHSDAYLATAGNAPKPHLSGSYSSQIKIGTNASGMTPDGVQTTALKSTGGSCLTASINSPANVSGTQGPIADGTLKVDIVMSQLPAGQAVMIKAIRVYAEVDVPLRGSETVCAGGEVSPISMGASFVGCTYQWYKNGSMVAGETSTSISHESGNELEKEHVYHCVVTTPSGDKIETRKFTVKDEECCSVEVDGVTQPAAQKLIWMDDFGTFTSAKNYWLWDYSKLDEPKKVYYTDGVDWQRELDKTGEAAPESSTFAVVGADGACNCPVAVNCPNVDANKFAEGYYTVAANVISYGMTGNGVNFGWAGYFGDGNEPSKNGYTFAPDHTYRGSDYGAMLYLNVGSDPGAVIYSRKIENLCDRKVTLKCYLNNFSRSTTNPISVFLRITDLASGETNVSPVYTRFANANNGWGTDWVEAKVSIELTGTELLFEIISESGGCTQNKDGNDLILDDILIYACSQPAVKMYFDLPTHLEETESCTADDVSLYVEESKMIQTNIGEDARYLYQYSTDPEDLESWKTIAGPVKDLEYKDLSSIISKEGYEDGDKVYFRVVLGVESILSTPGKIFKPNDACGAYSVSEPIELTIDCPACSEPADPVISAKGGKVNKAKKTVELCKGESTVLTTNDITGVDKNGDPYADYTITWHKETATSAVLEKASPAVEAPALTVKWEDATEDGVMYIVKVHDIFEDESKTTGCDKLDTIIVIANPVPEKTLAEVKPFCEGTLAANEAPTLTIDGYKLHWYEDADTTKATKEPSVIDKKAGEYEYFYVLEDSKTGCKGEVNPFAFTVNAIPTKVLEDAKVIEYIKGTGSVDISEKAGLEPTKEEYTLFWSTSAAAGDDGSKTAPKHDITKEDKVGKSYYVYQKNEETGCYGEKSEIVVIVNDSPKPVTKDTVVCVGKTIADLSSLVKKENADYELLWYASESDAKEDGVTTPASLTEEQAATPGEYKFYVAQKNTQTQAISEKAVVTVTVVGVDKPKVVEKAISYCANDEADDLENNVIKTEDASKFLYQDGFQWFVKDAESEEFIGPAGSKPEVNTSVQATVPVTYGVRQVYTIPSTGEQCIGADIEDFTVKTTFLDKPTVLTSIDYMKDDINAANSFDKNILSQNSSAVKHNSDANEFIWYDSEGTLIGKGGEGDAFSPTPKSDPEKANNGIDQSFTYLVSQTDGKCESEKATVEVNILATPKPNTKNVELCEGQLEDAGNVASVISINDLVDINTDKPGTTKDDFVLVWYDKDDKPISEPVLSSEMSEADGVEKTIIYKVSQKPVAGGAESAKSTIEVTVKARAKLDPAYLPNVCETTVDLKDGWVVANDVKIALKVEYTDAEGTTFSSDKSVVNKSEVYSVTASFDVVTLDKPAYACISNMEKIDVRIDTLQDVKIVGTETTCPNTAAEELRVEFYENVDDATIKYKWSGKIDAANAVKKEDVSTEILEGVAGDKFDFTVEVTAGTCTKTSPKHTITLGDGPVVGSIKFTEAGNTDLENGMEINVSSGKATLYTCGTDLTMDPTALENTNEEETPKAKFEWTSDNGSPVGSAEVAEVNPTEKTVYRVTYINKCATFVDITVIPVPLTVGGAIVGADICENESASIDAQIQCIEKPESIKWSRNGEAVSKYDGEGKLVFEPAKPEDSGEYTCVVTNRACVREIEPQTLLVKPYVKFAPEKEEYVIRRGETVNIINTITVPSDAVPAEITWTDNGKAVENSGKDYSVEVTKDMNLNVEMTEEGKYCPSDVDIVVKVDAVLQLAGEISDANMGEDGNYKMCLGETKTLVIDTTGTGKFVYPEKMSLAVTESQAGGSSRVLSNGTLNSDGKLEFKISPSTDATYSVSFVYREGEGEDEQIEELEIKITVLQKIEVKVPNGLEVCEGEEVEIALESVTPKGTVITWEDETIEGGKAEGETVVAKPTFSKPANGGHVSTYTYTAYASFDICETAEFPVKVKVNEPLTGELEDVTICENETARLDASSYKATSYIWTSDELETERSGQGITVTPKSTAVFKVSMERGGCKAEDELTVTVNPNPLILQVDSLSYRKIAVVVDATHNGKLTYRIDDGAESSFAEFDSLAYAPHVAYVTDEYGCSSSFDFMINAPLIIPNKWLSPNGDGETDRWEVPAISETYPDAKIVIYDRFGKKLIEYKGSDPGWDGVYNGQLMPTTDYWYEITVHEIDKVYTGHFTLLRR